MQIPFPSKHAPKINPTPHNTLMIEDRSVIDPSYTGIIYRILSILTSTYLLLQVVLHILRPEIGLFYRLEKDNLILQRFILLILILSCMVIVDRIWGESQAGSIAILSYSLYLLSFSLASIELSLRLAALLCNIPLLYHYARRDKLSSPGKRGFAWMILSSFALQCLALLYLFFNPRFPYLSLPARLWAFAMDPSKSTDLHIFDFEYLAFQRIKSHADLNLTQNRFAQGLVDLKLTHLKTAGFALTIACLCVLLILCARRLFFMRTKNLNLRPRHFQRLELIGPIIVFTLGLIYAGILASNMVRRSNYFQASTFDMGLFVQMFHNMARGQGPICTLERDQLLSHLQVHMSPIFYLMLPGFCLSRTGANLQIQQILVFVSGIIPIILIARKLEISLHLQLCFSALYLLNPAIFMSSFYDLHENVFLAPLLLWLLYAIFSERLWMILVTSVLCLLVKEDAGLYVICIGLYALCRPSHRSIRYKWVLAGIDILLPMLYFITVILYLQNFGDGAMLNRFNNLLLPGESGITAMMKNLLLNPTYALAGCFRPAEFFFLLVSLLSLAFFPLLQRYWYNFLLFLPFVVINLLSDYPYQHMLGFQYNYGSQTLLIVMVLLSFAEAFPKRPRYHFIRHTALVFGLVFSLFFTGYTLNDASTATMRQAESRRPMRSELNRLVGTWDSSLSTLTSAFLTSDLAHFPHLYELGKHQNIESSPAIEQIIVWEDLCDDLERLHLESLLQSGDFILEPTQSGEFFKVYRHK